MNNIFILVILIYFKFFLIIFKFRRLLKVLLIFEFIGLRIVFYNSVILSLKLIFLILILLVILACEARIGLSLLVGVVRFKFTKFVESYNIFII